MKDIENAASAVLKMDEQLRECLFADNGEPHVKKLWENTYIKKQTDKRAGGDEFTVSDHIRAMVYSMLTSGAPWNRIEPYIDLQTGRIGIVDEIFCQYDTDVLLHTDPEELCDKIKANKLGTQYIKKQMNALVHANIGKLLDMQREYGSVDNCYRQFVKKYDNLKTLVRELSTAGKPYKMAQLGEALTAEYLKNVGYDIGKPDRHICRILGSEYLGCSERKIVSPYEAIDIIAAIAKKLDKPAAEVDYILWAYCADGYGQVCTKRNPKCKELCSVKSLCNYNYKQED